MKNKSLYLIILLAGVVLFGLFTAAGALVSGRGSSSLADGVQAIHLWAPDALSIACFRATTSPPVVSKLHPKHLLAD
mgnify:CR=1 FL=1